MAHLSPQQKKIIEHLADGEWHCMASPKFFIKDDRKRISELNDKGYVIIGQPCDIRGKCGLKHTSNVFMRRLEGKPALNNYQLMHLAKQAETEPNHY